RHTGLEHRLKLHRVQMPPLPLRSVILERTMSRALRTDSVRPYELQRNHQLLPGQRQLDRGHAPRFVQTQQHPIMRRQRLHHAPRKTTSSRMQETPSIQDVATKFREEPKNLLDLLPGEAF